MVNDVSSEAFLHTWASIFSDLIIFLEFRQIVFNLKPNYFKKQCSSSSLLLTLGNNTGPNWPGVLSRLVLYI